VGLGGEVDDQRGMVLPEHGLHGGAVGNVSLHEGVTGISCVPIATDKKPLYSQPRGQYL